MVSLCFCLQCASPQVSGSPDDVSKQKCDTAHSPPEGSGEASLTGKSLKQGLIFLLKKLTSRHSVDDVADDRHRESKLGKSSTVN